MNEDSIDDDTSIQSSIIQGCNYEVDEDEDDNMFDMVISLLLTEGMLEEDIEKKWGGSRPGKAPNKDRDFQGAADRLIKHYFSGDSSVYDENDFLRRFRMERSTLRKIYEAIAGKGIFEHRYDCTGKAGIHPIVRITACLRVLMYGNSPDAFDEGFQIAGSTLIKSVREFAAKIIEHFGEAYLNRPPTQQELERILTINKNRGFPGLVACWDCKHFGRIVRYIWQDNTLDIKGMRPLLF
jgi:hypothetical protein